MLKKFLSEEARRSLETVEAEVSRLHELTDQWLAAALLKHARKAQIDLPMLSNYEKTYDSRLIWSLIPELCRRLGTVRIHPAEYDHEIRILTNYKLRIRIGHTLANVGRARSEPWRLLTREAANGNPVVSAIDRLCPGTMGDRDDPLVLRLTEVAHSRGTIFKGVWTKDILIPVVD
jgi:hypothetical protein